MVRTRWSPLVCFAGLGPGEVSAGGRKLVGISQRRTRAAARFQCAVHGRFDGAAVAAMLRLQPAERASLAADLDASVAVVEHPLDDVLTALLAVL
jgi:lipoate-protein ligase A